MVQPFEGMPINRTMFPPGAPMPEGSENIVQGYPVEEKKDAENVTDEDRVEAIVQ